jgi:solute carrier family 35 protein E3
MPIQNLCLHLNTVPANQMAKVFLLPCSIFLNFIFLRIIPESKNIPSLFLTVAGSAAFQLAESSATTAGLAISLIMVVTSWYSQHSMEQCRSKLGMTSLQQMLNVLPLSTAIVVATSPFVDAASLSFDVVALHYEPLVRLPWTWYLLLFISCCLGLIVTWTCFEIVSTMSALSYKVLSHAKTVILFAIGMAHNRRPVALIQWIGAVVTFAGIVWYLMLLECSTQRANSSRDHSICKGRTRIKHA